MSSIEAIKANSSTRNSAWIASTDKESQETSETFSAILQQLQTGGAGTASGGSDGSSEETETITRIMPDGTIRITVYRGSEIISQTEASPTPEEEKPTYLEVQSGAAPTAAGNVTSGSAAALMLNMLMQK